MTRQQFKKQKHQHKKKKFLNLLGLIILVFVVCGVGIGTLMKMNAKPKHRNLKRPPTKLTHKVVHKLPPLNKKVQGYYMYNLSTDNIDAFIHITKHQMYLQSGSNFNQQIEKNTKKQLSQEDNGKQRNPKHLQAQWLNYIRSTQKNQKHSQITIYHLYKRHHEYYLKGVEPNHKSQSIHFMQNGYTLKLNSQYTQDITQNLVNTLKFHKMSKFQINDRLKQDKLNLSMLN